MYSNQEQHHQTENESTPSVGVPASVIVSSNSITTPAPAVHDSQLTDSWVGQSHSPSPMVKQVEMPLYVEPHPLVAAAASTTMLGYLIFSPYYSVPLFCIGHCFYGAHPCSAFPKNKYDCWLAASVCFLRCLITCKGMIIPVVHTYCMLTTLNLGLANNIQRNIFFFFLIHLIFLISSNILDSKLKWAKVMV